MGCEESKDDSKSSGGIPSELVAVWYSDSGTTQEMFEIKSNGKVVFPSSSNEYDITVSGGNIKISTNGVTAFKYDSYKVEGKKFTATSSYGKEVVYFKK